MRIALATEGTYPFANGGVSVWCDQIIRGMPEHDFTIVAITGSGATPPVWETPDNVSSIIQIAMWSGSAPRNRSSKASRLFTRDVVMRLIRALLEPDLHRAKAAFASALSGWSHCASPGEAENLLTSGETVDLLMQRWSSDVLAVHWGGTLHRGAPTVGDALTVTRLIARALRPLQEPSPQVDLVHPAANGVAGLIALAAKWRHGTPFVLSEHGVYLRERYLSFGTDAMSWPVKWLMLRFYRLLTGLVYSEAALVAPGNVFNRRWERQDGVPEDSIRTVYNGVDPEFFEAADRQAEATISWVGRIDPLKDLVTLIKGFAIVHRSRPDVVLRIFGGTPAGNEGYRDELKALMETLDLTQAVRFEGRVDIIQDAYAAGQIVALTSISEGFPYTVIEAMSSGRATVSTDVGGVAEAVGDAGLVVPPRDPQAFATACLALLDDDELRLDLGRKARRRVLELFTLEQSIGNFRTIYDDVVQGVPQGLQGLPQELAREAMAS